MLNFMFWLVVTPVILIAIGTLWLWLLSLLFRGTLGG